MEIRHIRSFLAVADELHFSRAAKKLHITQPTLSQHIQLLERDLEVQLVARTSRKVELTPSGHAFLTNAQSALLKFEQARADAWLAAAGRIGSIRVGYSSIASRTVLPSAVGAFHNEASRVHFHLEQLRSGPQLVALDAGELDVALTSGRPTASDLSARKLHNLQVRAVVTVSDPLAARRSVRFSDLEDRRCILFERATSPMMYDAISSGARQAGVELDVADTVSDGWHAAALVAAHSMVGFTSDVERGFDQSGPRPNRQTVSIPLVDPTPRLALHAMWRTTNESSLLVRFIEELVTAGEVWQTRPGPA